MAHAADKEQIEMLSKWWRDYGRGILLAIIIGLIIAFGWKYWNKQKTTQRAHASQIYSMLVEYSMQKNASAMNKELTLLKDKHKDSPYAALGSMLVAKVDVESNKLDSALEQLNWVVENATTASFAQIAQLKIARIFLAQKQYDKAQAALTPVRDKAFLPMLLSVQGDIYAAQGKIAAADKAYQQAQSGYSALNLNDPFLPMKINSRQK